MVQLPTRRRREHPRGADSSALRIRSRHRTGDEIVAPIAVEIVDARNAPAERGARFSRLIRPQHGASLAAQEIHATTVCRRRTDEEIRVTVTVLVAGE